MKLSVNFAQAHRLSESMTSTYESRVADSISSLDSEPIEATNIQRISSGELLGTIKYLVGYKAPGADGIFNIMLKHVGLSCY